MTDSPVEARTQKLLQAVQLVDEAIVARKGERVGKGELACPACPDGVIDYRFVRQRRIQVQAKCRTAGCVEFRS